MKYAEQILTMSACVALSACVGDAGVTEPPMGGGQRNQPGSCLTNKLNEAWKNAQLFGQRTQPVKCPYTVDVPNQNIVFSADLKGPKQTIYAGSGAELGPIYSTLEPYPVAVVQRIPAYWQDDPNVTSNRTLTFNGNYQSAHYPPGGPGPWSHDSGTVLVDQTTYGPATAFVTMSGSARLTPGYMVLPYAPINQTFADFRAVTDVDTNAYQFSWNVDGTTLPASDSARLRTTFSTPGVHHVTAFAMNAAGGVDTITSAVTVQLGITINGPLSVTQNSTGTYSATVGAGGASPYTYQWKKNGSAVGTGATYTYFAARCGIVTITVDITDVHGYIGHGSTDVQTVRGTCA